MNSSGQKTDIEKFNQQHDNFFAIYHKVGSFCSGIPNEKPFGDEQNKVCRFCKKSLNETSFDKKAHIIASFLDGLDHIQFNECDKCNETFSKQEQSLANFIGLRRFFRTPDQFGKSKSPIYTDPKTGLTLYGSDKGIVIENAKDIIIQNGPDEFSIPATKLPYTPLNIFKTFIKFYYSFLTDESIKFYSGVEKFLISNDMDNDPWVQFCSKNVVHSVSSGEIDTPCPILFFFEKRPDISENYYPKVIFVIFIYNSMFQIIPPFNIFDKDLISNPRRTMPVYPYFLNKEIPRISYNSEFNGLDFSSTEKIKDEKEVFKVTSLAGSQILSYTEEEYNKLGRRGKKNKTI